MSNREVITVREEVPQKNKPGRKGDRERLEEEKERGREGKKVSSRSVDSIRKTDKEKEREIR